MGEKESNLAILDKTWELSLSSEFFASQKMFAYRSKLQLDPLFFVKSSYGGNDPQRLPVNTAKNRFNLQRR